MLRVLRVKLGRLAPASTPEASLRGHRVQQGIGHIYRSGLDAKLILTYLVGPYLNRNEINTIGSYR